jgi:hypothetical protein
MPRSLLITFFLTLARLVRVRKQASLLSPGSKRSLCPVEYNVLLPDGYDSAKGPLPLLLFIMWDFKIPHEYHLVRGADHVGRTIRPRTTEALGFLARVLNPPPADPEADALRKQLEPLKRASEKKP